MRRFSVLLILLLSVNSVFASPLKLNYSLFFGYMKTLKKLQYGHVTSAFYLRDKNTGSACLIKQADMVVDQKREPINFEKTGRLLPFYSDQHRKDGAMIEVDLLAGQANYQCDLQVTVMAKESELDSLSSQKLVLISEQLEGLLKKNAGMIGKYFLPDFSGVHLHLAAPLNSLQLNAIDKQILIAQNGDLLISKKLLASLDFTSLSQFNIVRVSPWLSK
ncbi:DUF2987 domain-containing protein [Psychromonas antarctica]|uniref:DUF2987 domain-containing protein n=1 Tax=Psychromonas antarctica TaxID=67573 RepID=UPI001EE97F50|nr:DUF2987 domain-containing protein [Psychromonas antarctica]MCG6200929.1 DUF2987 domain-containing protein [Psychromonas antarctica]